MLKPRYIYNCLYSERVHLFVSCLRFSKYTHYISELFLKQMVYTLWPSSVLTMNVQLIHGKKIDYCTYFPNLTRICTSSNKARQTSYLGVILICFIPNYRYVQSPIDRINENWQKSSSKEERSLFHTWRSYAAVPWCNGQHFRL